MANITRLMLLTLNKALEGKPEATSNIEDIIKNISKFPPAVRNNGGGHYNHTCSGLYCRQTVVANLQVLWPMLSKALSVHLPISKLK
jgi:hypothetical protein